MTKAQRKFELYRRLSDLGFTFEESQQLRRIEMTLQRWSEKECGDGSDWAIERDEKTDVPFMTYHGDGKARRYRVADREAGALRRLKLIVEERNEREISQAIGENDRPHDRVIPYHQTDPRGCMLYLCKDSDLPKPESLGFTVERTGAGFTVLRNASGCGSSHPVDTIEEARAYVRRQILESNYTRGLAVCC